MKKIILIFFLICSTGHAADFRGSTWLFVDSSKDLGYETGIGAAAEGIGKFGPVAVVAEGHYAIQKKITASEGYRYGFSGAGRLYWKKLFAEAGYWWGGYRSEFNDINPWEKHAHGEFYGLGLDGDYVDLALRYSPREAISPNEIEWIRGEGRFKFYRNFFGIISLEYTEFNAANNDSSRRITGTSTQVGIGIDW